MKVPKVRRTQQRKIIQGKLDRLSKLNEPPPPSGWIKAIRVSLGLTMRQLADRLGVEHGTINQLEKRESLKRVTLESVDLAARAMNCKLIYAIVPEKSDQSLEEIIHEHALQAAQNIVRGVSHTMRLEAQGTSEKAIAREIQRVAEELIASNDSRIWSGNKKKRGRT